MARKSYSQQERLRLQETLLTVTLQCMAERGLTHSSVDYLCRQVGISKSFFYQLFASKEDLVLQALRYQQPKLLDYARSLMDDPTLSWREGVEQFLRSCCYGSQSGVAVLSMEEEQEIHRSLAPEHFRAFQQDQRLFFQKILEIFGVSNAIDAGLFGNLALVMIMVRKAIPGTLPFLMADSADAMVEFQIRALTDEMERLKM